MSAIERVARELASQLGAECRGGEQIVSIADLQNAELDIGHVDLLAVARAAVAALREPTEAMLRVGDAVAERKAYVDWTVAAFSLDGSGEVFSAMIDAALAEPQ